MDYPDLLDPNTVNYQLKQDKFNISQQLILYGALLSPSLEELKRLDEIDSRLTQKDQKQKSQRDLDIDDFRLSQVKKEKEKIKKRIGNWVLLLVKNKCHAVISKLIEQEIDFSILLVSADLLNLLNCDLVRRDKTSSHLLMVALQSLNLTLDRRVQEQVEMGTLVRTVRRFSLEGGESREYDGETRGYDGASSSTHLRPRP